MLGLINMVGTVSGDKSKSNISPLTISLCVMNVGEPVVFLYFGADRIDFLT